MVNLKVAYFSFDNIDFENLSHVVESVKFSNLKNVNVRKVRVIRTYGSNEVVVCLDIMDHKRKKKK